MRPVSLRTLACGLTFALAACLASAEEALLFRVSVENPSAHFQAAFARRFAAALADRAGLALKVEFYDGARLFKDADVIAALARGSVEMALPGIWQLDRTVPDSAALMLPAVYGVSGQRIRALVDGPLGELIEGRIESALPVRVLGRWLDLGQAHLFSAGRGLRSISDIVGKRVRVAGGRANEERIRLLGGNPLSIPPAELAAYLDQGLVDAMLSTYETVASAGFAAHGLTTVYEDGEYYPFFLPLVSRAAWERLPGELQASIVELWEGMIEEGRAASSAAQAEAKAALAKAGMRIAVPSAAESARTRSRLRDEEEAMARRLGISEEALSLLEAALPRTGP